MSETNISFKCEHCGYDRIDFVKKNVTVLEEVIAIHYDVYLDDNTDEPTNMVGTRGYKLIKGDNAGYACGKCHTIVADTNDELIEYLQRQNMIVEWRDVDHE